MLLQNTANLLMNSVMPALKRTRLKAFAIVIKSKERVVIKLGHKVNIKRLLGGI